MTTVILISLSVGFILGCLLGYWREIKSVEEVEDGNRIIINELNKELNELKKQLNDKNI